MSYGGLLASQTDIDGKMETQINFQTHRFIHVNAYRHADKKKQEFIPVGCVMTAAVPATRCQCQHGGLCPTVKGNLHVDRQTPVKGLPSLAVANNVSV